MEYTPIELRMMAVASTGGMVFTYLIGGIDNLAIALLVFMTVDYITGIWKAIKYSVIDSTTGWEGIRRKGIMLLIVIIGHWLDAAMGMQAFRNMIIFAYLGNEGFSICENLDKLGYGAYIPNALRRKLTQLREEKQKIGVDKK